MAAVVLNRALDAIRRGGGPPMSLIRLCGGALVQVPHSAPGRIALKLAFMLFFTGNGEALGILFQMQVDVLTRRIQTELTLGGVRQA